MRTSLRLRTVIENDNNGDDNNDDNDDKMMSITMMIIMMATRMMIYDDHDETKEAIFAPVRTHVVVLWEKALTFVSHVHTLSTHGIEYQILRTHTDRDLRITRTTSLLKVIL